jgi:pimeloyl-ACP methyl ester carboxylesterase
VIRYDNRDIGLSGHLDHLGRPNMVWQLLKAKMGLAVKASYGLQDMAKDALGILDALGISQAHIVGVSMGGMISQRIAITAPKRILSLTSIMSTSAAPGLPEAKPEVIRAMLNRPKSQRIEDIVSHSVNLFQLIGSPAYPQDASYPDRIKMGVERAYHPEGMLRQLLAIAADTKRYQFLSEIKCPTLVIHGNSDPLVPIACGKDTADRIAGSRFVAIEGMGHDLPPGVTQLLSDLIVPHLDSKL